MAKVIYNNLIPFKGYRAMAFWPVIFARKAAKYLQGYVKNHESIHLRQQLEVLIVSIALLLMLVLSLDLSWWWMAASPFVYYVWYVTEYLVRLCIYRNHWEAYRNISAEQEAFLFQMDFNYLPNDRRPFAWLKYITSKTYRR